MEKKALLEYALFARKELETQIALSLNKIGIYSDHVSYAHIVGDRTIIEGISESFDKRVYDLRKRISDECLKDQKFDTLVEEFAYTWFNRIIAIRFMEVHDYFPHGFRVLTSRDGSYEPEILKNLPYVLGELQLDADVIQSLKDQNKIEELYRYVLIKQCNALNPIFPELFDKQESYLEYLLPNNLLGQESVIRKIESIPEEDFLNDVEIVGWLYQYYVASNREEYRKAKIVTKELVPTLSQIFTPDWIVRYMADNSIGRLWMESYKDSQLKSSLNSYVDDCSQDDETKQKIERIRYKNVNPENLKIIEPCCGSGHILVYVFDLLYKMYLEKGYSSKDIPSLILKNNLYGLDIDKRAAQLAKFSLIMKARSIDSRFLNNDHFVLPKIYEIKDSQILVSSNYEECMTSLHFNKQSINLAKYLVETFKDAKIIGSLLKVDKQSYDILLNDIDRCLSLESPGLYEQDFYHLGLRCLVELINLAGVLSNEYDVMITNPPYLGISNLEEKAKTYLSREYPDSKADMFSMFMEALNVKQNGFRAIVNPDSWMFLSTYESLRTKLFSKWSIINMIHLGMGEFDATVHTTSFVLRHSLLNYSGVFYRLTESNNKEYDFLNRLVPIFNKSMDVIKTIPSYIIGYWLSTKFINIFENGKPLCELADPRQGLATSDNDRFIRQWFELDINRICFNATSLRDAQETKMKWFPYNKGGDLRKWYGDNDYVVNWENDGYEIRNVKNEKGRIASRAQNTQFYFKPSVTWSKIGTKKTSFRYKPNGHIFDVAGTSLFSDEDTELFLIGLLNSVVVEKVLEFMSPSLNFEVGHIAKQPVIVKEKERVISLTKENIKICKEEWDDFEESWDFKKHPLVDGSSLISDAFENWQNKCLERFEKLKNNEIQLNKIFISIYGLDEELNPEINNNDIYLRLAEQGRDIKSLISYFIGCIFGRYSYKKDGICYAGGNLNKFNFDSYVDEDGILPIYRFVGIHDGLTKVICDLVKEIYGETYYKQNIDFIAESLGRRIDEGSEETLNRYLNEEFYTDHLKVYSKRPIYWMFSSGKNGAFKCLLYMHRYNKNTLGIINSKYFLPRTALYKTEKERIEFLLKTQTDSKQVKSYEKELVDIEKSEQELLEYGQILDHMANQYLDLNLDDGVRTNYLKFQNIILETNGATIKKNLLIDFGLEEKKKKGAK